MWVRRLELVDFRNYESVAVELGPGLTAVIGANGQGKSNLVEAVAYLPTRESFRGAPPAALVREGCQEAIVRAEVEQPDGRVVTIECALAVGGRDRVLVNKQRPRRPSELLDVVRVTVFSPDDLALLKEGPAVRRRFLDLTMVGLHPRLDADRRDLERILRHKATLLKQAGGRLDEDAALTLDVWNTKLTEVGEIIGRARAELVEALAPEVASRRTASWRPVGERSCSGTTRPGAGPAWPTRWRLPAPTRCGARSAWSARTVTTSTSCSTACRPGPTPRRGSSGRSPWRCAWPATGW